METKKKPGCLKIALISIGVFIGILVILGIIGSLTSDSTNTTTGTPSGTSTGTSGADANTNSESNSTPKDVELFNQAQSLFNEGKYTEAMAAVDEAIKANSTEQYTAFKTEIQTKLDARKAELEAGFEIKDDKVENIKFISPASGVKEGLVFYPYIGIKDSKKYMLLRVGYQEPVSNSLFVFSEIKVRVGEELVELDFNPLNKMNNVDLFGSGMTEIIDLEVDRDIEKLLNNQIPSTEEVIVRFQDISNQVKDYTLSAEQKQVIANIVEYYSYLQ